MEIKTTEEIKRTPYWNIKEKKWAPYKEVLKVKNNLLNLYKWLEKIDFCKSPVIKNRVMEQIGEAINNLGDEE